MKFFTIPMLLVISAAVQAQAPDFPFERRYSVPSALWTDAATIDDDGNIYTLTEARPNKNLQLTKIRNDATHAWTKAYPQVPDMGIYNNSIAIGPEGLIVGGYAIGQGTSSRDGIILRIDPEDGSLLQATRIDVNGESNAIHGITRIEGGFIAAGRAYGGGGSYDMLLAKLDDSGTMLWSKTYGSSGWDWAEEALPTSDGGFVLVGYGDSLLTNTTLISHAGYVVRTDALGNELWARSIGSGVRPDQPSTAAVGTDGSIYVGGRSLGYGNLSDAGSITKISSTGEHLWTRFIEGGIEVHRLLPLANGGVAWLLQPNQFTGGAGSYDMAWGTFDADGDLTSSHYHGSEYGEVPNQIFIRSDGGYIVIGPKTVGATSAWDLSVIYTDASGDSDCNNVTLPLTWLPATAWVTPFTSVTGSGFDAFPFTLLEESVAVATYNPCCNVRADFTMSQLGDVFTWHFIDTSTGVNTYLWDFGDGATSTEASPTHTYAANGEYTVCLTVASDCGEAVNCQQLALNVGVDEFDHPEAFLLYPTPTDQFITIAAQYGTIQIAQILDLNGRVIFEENQPPVGTLSLFTGGLSTGVYLVRLTLTDGSLYHKRFVVAH